MKNQLFQDLTTPHPPARLRAKILTAASKNVAEVATPSFIDQCWQSRSLRWSWLATVSVLSLFLLFWNPPFPAISVPEKTESTANEPDLTDEDPSLRTLLSSSRKGQRDHLIFGQVYR